MLGPLTFVIRPGGDAENSPATARQDWVIFMRPSGTPCPAGLLSVVRSHQFTLEEDVSFHRREQAFLVETGINRGL